MIQNTEEIGGITYQWGKTYCSINGTQIQELSYGENKMWISTSHSSKTIPDRLNVLCIKCETLKLWEKYT
jgi:hypothetical protein